MNRDNSAPRLSLAAIAALQLGNKIQAIKITRVETGLGLSEAMNLVDAHVATDPALQELLKSKSGGTALGWIFMFILVFAALIYFWPT